jgi:signal transduction histidine kinase
VSVQVLEAGLQLQVADSGPGIRAEERERVFERFWRGAAVDQPGTGLGLAIVREAARGLGGDAQVAQRPGQPGCAVVVRLP